MSSELRCCVIDDEPLAARLIADYVNRTPELVLIGVHNSAGDAFKEIMGGEVDLVFLDIEMPQLSGMEFAKVIPPSCRIVFITAYDRYAVQGFRVNAVDYLLKPVSYEEFLEAVDRARKAMGVSEHVEEQRFILVKSDHRQLQLDMEDISLVESLGDYVKIYVSGEERPVVSLMSMRAVEQALAKFFLRVHRSYIINTHYINIIEKNRVQVAGKWVPVSDKYRQSLVEYTRMMHG